jgi:Tol biopolymer transport system component
VTLTSGTRLGAYEVLAKIGEGGMGEVYRARDTRLNREVALKVLPNLFADDPDRLVRFTREAQTLASLNHPNIAQIHGLEEAAPAGGSRVRALVMELVDGPTLEQAIATAAGQPEAERVSAGRRDKEGGGARRGLLWDDAIVIARQIAEALEAAHERGIVHRDLKPSNVKIRSDGTVKVLDFGLAKALEPAGMISSSVSQSPTITTPAMTQAGMILGTAAYMSPEQARGRPLDKRSDLWAFGAVLFEMVSGHRAFPGEDVPDTLANVLKAEPDWARLPPDLPLHLTQLIRACLQKNPRERLADAQDARLLLDGRFVAGAAAASAPPAAPRNQGTRAARIAGVALAGAVAGAGAVWWSRPTAPPAAQPMRLSINLPLDRAFLPGGSPHRGIAISPDGSQIAYVASTPGRPGGHLVLRSIQSLEIRDLAGTDTARQPFFSPDGQWVAFLTETGGALKKISLSGGAPITLLDGINGARWTFGAWAGDDIVIGGGGTGLVRVPAEPGTARPLTALDKTKDESGHWSPTIARGGRVVLFGVTHALSRQTHIDAVSLESGERRRVVENAAGPVALDSGHLLFQRDEALLIASFDPAVMALTGPETPVVEQVRRDGSAVSSTAQLAVSRTGRLAYFPAVDPNVEMGFVSRTGDFTRIDLPAGQIDALAVSPDGQQIGFSRAAGREQAAFVLDLARGSTRKLTETGVEFFLAWHPVRRAATISARRETSRGIFLRGLDGSEQLLVDIGSAAFRRNGSWSPDGREFAHTAQNGSLHDVFVVTLGETVQDRAWLNAIASEHSPRFSPDGRWMAYVSDASGRQEVLVRPYPTGEPAPVSITGGNAPLWSRDGTEIFFQGLDGDVRKVFRASISRAGSSLRIGRPEAMFEMRRLGPQGSEAYIPGGNSGGRYDVMPDGRFVMLKSVAATDAREIVIVDNWIDEVVR